MKKTTERWVIPASLIALLLFGAVVAFLEFRPETRGAQSGPSLKLPPAKEAPSTQLVADAGQWDSGVSSPGPTPTHDPQPSGTVAAAAGFAKSTADDYRNRARYPRSSHPLEEGNDPILNERIVSPATGRGPNGEEPTLTVFPERVSYESPNPIRLYAYLSKDGQRVPAREMRGEVVAEDMRSLARLDYRDDGSGGDGAASDYLYTAVFEPDPSPTSRLSVSFLVRVRATTVDGEERAAATGVRYSSPQAHLTGRYEDALVDGNLEVRAEVEVSSPGRYHLAASLYAADQRALAWAQNAALIDPGRQWITLRFYGLILRERGADGPYVLRYVALATTTQMPNAKNDLVENAYVTKAYPAAAFTDKPFDDPELLDAARRVEHDTGGARE